jgi:hypothetical protein
MGEPVHTVFIVGDSLFAEAMAHLLGHLDAVKVVGVAAGIDDALVQLPEYLPDMILFLHSTQDSQQDLCPLLAAYPDIPILRAGLDAAELRIISSRRLGTQTADLLAAIQSLPSRR